MYNETVLNMHYGIRLRCKENLNMKFSGKWMELENTVLSEVAQTHKKQMLQVYSLLWFQLLNCERTTWSNYRNQEPIKNP